MRKAAVYGRLPFLYEAVFWVGSKAIPQKFMPRANVKEIFMCLIFYGLKEISVYVAPSLADAFDSCP
ncbi:hypothetical protein BK138_22020 [Paenibacillus rhizosphaerae]|uniref:Uncharacterized protein n=1 Tax=Paenibacillus rhizosphaerae TaxID=297318 RepID=A0A1R1ELR9_9BACL|nr:hypothetical protein BK138_22020 [Paenibacillus rhizosphaerae]OXL86079.1 hypothetical protein BCV73_25610 [Paenibacillus sp. SSG-1]